MVSLFFIVTWGSLVATAEPLLLQVAESELQFKTSNIEKSAAPLATVQVHYKPQQQYKSPNFRLFFSHENLSPEGKVVHPTFNQILNLNEFTNPQLLVLSLNYNQWSIHREFALWGFGLRSQFAYSTRKQRIFAKNTYDDVRGTQYTYQIGPSISWEWKRWPLVWNLYWLAGQKIVSLTTGSESLSYFNKESYNSYGLSLSYLPWKGQGIFIEGYQISGLSDLAIKGGIALSVW